MTASEAVVSGLAGGAAVLFGVTAVDGAGNESSVSAGAGATPLSAPVVAPTPTPTPTPTPAPTATPTPTPPVVLTPPPVVVTPPPAALRSLRLSGHVVLGRRQARLSFRTSAAATLTVALRRHGRAAGTTRVPVPAGTSRWRVGRTVAGLRLKRGRYRLTLTAPANAATVAFSVR